MTRLQVSAVGLGTKCPSTDRLLAANDPAVQDFSTQLDAFLADPVCKGGENSQVKRAITDSKGFMNAKSLAPTIAGASLLTTGLDSLLSNVFDLKFGNAANVHFASIVTQSNNFPGLDKNLIALDALCLGKRFGDILAAYRPANREICVIGPSRGSRRRDLQLLGDVGAYVFEGSGPFEKRNWYSGNFITDAPGTAANPSDRPFTGALLEQFSRGALNVGRYFHIGGGARLLRERV